MSTTDGLVRGMAAEDTGSPISVPVGREALGRVMNILGKPIDERGYFSVGCSIQNNFHGARSGSRRFAGIANIRFFHF